MVRSAGVFLFGNVETFQSTDDYTNRADIFLSTGELSDNTGFYRADRMPLYVLFLAGCFKLFGRSPLYGLMFPQWILSFYNILFICLLIRDFLSRKWFLTSLFILSIYPYWILFGMIGAAEMMASCLLTLGMYAFLSSIEKESLFFWILFSIIFSMLVFTRPIFLFMPFILIVFMVLKTGIKKNIKRIILFMLIFSLPIIVWDVRNYNIFHKFVPLTTIGGLNLYLGNNPLADGRWHSEHASEFRNNLSAHDRDNEVTLDMAYKKAAREYIFSHPLRFILLIPKKLSAIFQLDVIRTLKHILELEPNISRLSFYNIFFYWASLPFFIYGAVRYYARESAKYFLLPIIYIAFFHGIFFHGHGRLRMPIDGFILIFAIAGFNDFLRLLLERFRVLLGEISSSPKRFSK